MILTVVYLAFEALTAVLLLHSLYDKQFKISVYAGIYMLLDMLFFCLIQTGTIHDAYSALGYVLIFLYTGLEFGFQVDRMIVNDTLCTLFAIVFQFVFGSITLPFVEMGCPESVYYFVINILTLLMTLMLYKKQLLGKISHLFLEKNILVFGVCAVDFFMIMRWLLSIKLSGEVLFFRGIGVLLLVSLFAVLVYNLGKSTLRAKQLKTENEMQKLYNASFEGLVTEMRLRQHEFDNHLNAIYGMYYVYKTYDELIAAQQEYANEVCRENKFNKLLASGNYTLIGFLYHKFLDIDASKIEIEYHVAVKEMQSKVPLYVLVELIGNLLDNAKEALLQQKKRRLLVCIIETAEQIDIEIANESEYIDYKTLDSFFEKGKSSKGTERGYGLFHVKKLCKENDVLLTCQNKTISESNYLSFAMSVAKQ